MPRPSTPCTAEDLTAEKNLLRDTQRAHAYVRLTRQLAGHRAGPGCWAAARNSSHMVSADFVRHAPAQSAGLLEQTFV
jgi:hypothetical protein